MEIKNFGFIILRHVNSNLTNTYWIRCYDCIRKFYPNNKIIIIDDNSDYKFITDKNLINTEYIQSEYIKRGELLPYIYYSKNKWFDYAIILHDSVFINKQLNINFMDCQAIWHFMGTDCGYNNYKENETILLNKLNNNKELFELYDNRNNWKGVYGCMTIISYEFNKFLDNRYGYSNLIEVINNRESRMAFERIIGVMISKNMNLTSLYGYILTYVKWNDMTDLKKMESLNLPIIKIRSHR
jgi:hypothetical protein